jgi:hypothetical protein
LAAIINKKINEAMDDASSNNINQLIEAATLFSKSKSDALKEFLKINS